MRELYLEYAAKLNQQQERAFQGHDTREPMEVRFDSRDEFIETMVNFFPSKSREDWALEWERMQDNMKGQADHANH